MRVCLITPPSPFLLDQRVFCSLGILKVGAVLEQSGTTVDHLDLTGVANYEEAVRDYPHKDAVFAITATTPQLPAAIRVRRSLSGKTVLGGPHATLVHAAAKRGNERAKKALEGLLREFDVVVAGDGEKSIFTALHSKGLVDADDPKGVMWMTSKDFTDSPWPARHLVDMDSYHYTVDGKRATSAVFQLGCPFECGFCGGRLSPMLRRIRSRSTENIIAEMRHLHDKHGVEGLMCYDDKTEILTGRGWLHFADLTSADVVCTLREDGIIDFSFPRAIWKYEYTGNLVTFKNRHIDLAVTPEHRMWVRTPLDSRYAHRPAGVLKSYAGPFYFSQTAEWDGIDFAEFSIPAYKQVFLGRHKGTPKVQDGQRTFVSTVWVQFMAWYLSEGSCYRPKVRNGRGYRICIKQDNVANPEKVREIAAILDALGYKYSYSSNQFHIDSKELYEYLRQFGTSHRKHVPREFKLMSKRLLNLFIDTYIKGDGHRQETGQTSIASSSKRMRDDLQEMIIKSGRWACTNDQRNRVQLSKQKEVTINSPWGSGHQIGEEYYSGTVHCVTVASGVVLVRRNGKAVWCGNCYDDELNVNKGLVDLMHQIRDMGIDWRLRGFVKAELFTDEQAEALFEAGFRWLLCGFESAHPRILRNINKKATLEDNTKMLRIAHAHGLKVKALMSFGHPGESEETITATRDWLLEEKPDDFDATVITLYPGTPYWDQSECIGEPIYRYEYKGDVLYSENVDFTKEVAYYKGIPGEYHAFVWTDHLTREQLASLRDSVEDEVRTNLRIPYPASAAAVNFEHSMGMSLPPSILRSSQ